MASLPGDILTEPKEHIYFNGPFVGEQSMNIRLRNQGAKAIGWMVKSTNPGRFVIKPTSGKLDTQGDVVLSVKCEPFDYNKDMAQDRVTVEWTEAPEDADHFSRDWFHQSRVIRRHVFPIDYNL